MNGTTQMYISILVTMLDYIIAPNCPCSSTRHTLRKWNFTISYSTRFFTEIFLLCFRQSLHSFYNCLYVKVKLQNQHRIAISVRRQDLDFPVSTVLNSTPHCYGFMWFYMGNSFTHWAKDITFIVLSHYLCAYVIRIHAL